MKIFLAGEGKSELGGWSGHPCYHDGEAEPGLIETLLRRVKQDGWAVSNAICWKNIPKYRAAHSRQPAEAANVLGLVLKARDAGCQVVAFSRDRDGDHDREQDVQQGLERARKIFPDCPAIIGGMAVQKIESWVASLAGHRRAEDCTDPGRLLEEADLASMRAIAETADLSKLPADAESLRSWLKSAAQVFGVKAETLLGPG